MNPKQILIPVLLLLFISFQTQAQLIAGPMLGQVELRTAKIWVEVPPGSSVELLYWKKENANRSGSQRLSLTTNAAAWFAPVTFDLVGLDINTTYEYQVSTVNKSNGKKATADGEFTTKDLWEWRKPLLIFLFLPVVALTSMSRSTTGPENLMVAILRSLKPWPKKKQPL